MLSSTVSLVLALLCLALWVLLGIVFPVGWAAIHLLLAAGATLLVRWWALKEA